MDIQKGLIIGLFGLAVAGGGAALINEIKQEGSNSLPRSTCHEGRRQASVTELPGGKLTVIFREDTINPPNARTSNFTVDPGLNAFTRLTATINGFCEGNGIIMPVGLNWARN